MEQSTFLKAGSRYRWNAVVLLTIMESCPAKGQRKSVYARAEDDKIWFLF
jgi:hypothetical protein